MKKEEKKEPQEEKRIASISGWSHVRQKVHGTPTHKTHTHREHDANLDEVIPGITGAERSLEEQVVSVRLLLGLNQLVILLAVQ